MLFVMGYFMQITFDKWVFYIKIVDTEKDIEDNPIGRKDF